MHAHISLCCFRIQHGEQDQLGTCSSDCRCIRGGAAVFTLKTSQRLLSSYNSSVSDPRQARIGFSGQALSGWRAWESRSEFKKDELLRTAVGFRLQLCRHIVLFFHLLWRTPNCNKEALAYLYHTFMVLHGFDALVFKPIHLKGIPSVSNYKTFCFF